LLVIASHYPCSGGKWLDSRVGKGIGLVFGCYGLIGLFWGCLLFAY